MTPPGSFGGRGLVCRFTMLRPSTSTRCSFGRTSITTARLPLSLPEMTTTRSPLRIRAGMASSTSGASETIFMKFFSRSSRATGPKMRVPRGFWALSMITAAFSSKAMKVPSSRPCSLRVRTTTARTTSPFLMAPFGHGLLDGADDDVAHRGVAPLEPPRCGCRGSHERPCYRPPAGVSRPGPPLALSRLLDDLDQAPALLLDSGRHSSMRTSRPPRPRWLVVGVQLRRAADGLPVDRVRRALSSRR